VKLSVCFLPYPCLATHTTGHYRRSSQNHRLSLLTLPPVSTTPT